MKPSGIITFLSDFGLADWFVAAVKGEILKINKNAKIIDITHSIQPHDIRSAAFVLSQCYADFPVGTIHLVVVDPGVGNTRRCIAAVSGGYFFVAPDNGVLSYVLDKEATIYDIPVPHRASVTFHGRDIFAPAAAQLSLGNKAFCKKIPVSGCERFEFPVCKTRGDTVIGEIVYIDHFGNCITTIPVESDAINLCIDQTDIPVRECYAEGQKKEVIAVRGSSGFYEIVVNQGNAQYILKSKVGTRVTAYVQ
ncbi:SAM-dependent chlorinase/fluorinase [candidate division WOR-3 bacterium]|nr:SAM-dependent chlorinase/fluorinase [candidate division WOR-3 bacterium]